VDNYNIKKSGTITGKAAILEPPNETNIWVASVDVLPCWTYTKRKTRQDALNENHKKLIYNFWFDPENSRPSGSKHDVKRLNLYSKHPVCPVFYVLQKKYM